MCFRNYKFIRGHAQMKSLQDLSAPRLYISEGDAMYPSHIIIPQLDCMEMPIITHDVTTASKMLGVHFSLAGDSPMNVEHMVQKGLDWVDCLRTKPVSRGDAWLSFFLQLFPEISWGLVMVCMPPKQLNGCIQHFYAKAFPFLASTAKSRRNGGLSWKCIRASPCLICPWWLWWITSLFFLAIGVFYGQAHSNALAMAYDNFLIEAGLYGSPLHWSYKDFCHLSTESTWFQNL